jgi:hypothetical protein
MMLTVKELDKRLDVFGDLILKENFELETFLRDMVTLLKTYEERIEVLEKQQFCSNGAC